MGGSRQDGTAPIAQGFISESAGTYQRRWSALKFLGAFEHVNRGVREGDDMLSTSFHPLGRDYPKPIAKIYFVPSCQTCFARANDRKNNSF